MGEIALGFRLLEREGGIVNVFFLRFDEEVR